MGRPIPPITPWEKFFDVLMHVIFLGVMGLGLLGGIIQLVMVLRMLVNKE